MGFKTRPFGFPRVTICQCVINNGFRFVTRIQVGLLCLVGLSVSYPAQPNERNQRRRNQVSAPQPFRSRQSERISDLPDYQPSRPKKISQYQPLGPQAFTAQERYANPAPQQQKRKAPVQQLKPATENVRDYEAAPSNAYGGGGYEAGSYDEGHLKFEQGVQNHANSYNSDQVLLNDAYLWSVRKLTVVLSYPTGSERRTRPVRHRRSTGT